MEELLPAFGVDLGTVRIGVAASDDLGIMAHPVRTLDASGDWITELRGLMEQRKAPVLVVGIPRSLDGTFGIAAQKAREIVAALREELACKVIEWDERLTTAAAHKALRDAGRDVRKGRSVIDQVAAQMILQSWLDAQALRAL